MSGGDTLRLDNRKFTALENLTDHFATKAGLTILDETVSKFEGMSRGTFDKICDTWLGN